MWFSPPKVTLALPSLRPKAPAKRRVEALYPGLTGKPGDALDFASIVLVAGGTGIAPMWQIMRQVAGGVGGCEGLRALPLTLLYSCRGDDALLLDELDAHVQESPKTRTFVTVTDAASGGVSTVDAASHPELSVRRGRITEALLAEALERHLPGQASQHGEQQQQGLGPRVVVSGPSNFGIEVGALLSRIGVSREAVVTLQA